MSRNKTCFNSDWLFTKEQIEPGAVDYSKMTAVTLPHTWNAEDGDNGGNNYYRAKCWYAKKFDRPQGDVVYVEFGAVSQIAEVFLNGKKLAQHEGGFSIFRVDITEALKDGENVLVVSADNSPNEITYPQFADFTFFGGIYRDVALITVPKSHFCLDYHGAPGIAVTPVEKNGKWTVTVEGYTKVKKENYLFEIIDAEGAVVASAEGTTPKHAFVLENPHLWDGMDDPYLYTAKITMEGSGDEVSARFGVRTYSVDPQKGFFLNGRSYPLHGVSRHQCTEGVGWALKKENHETDAKLIREVGANTIRLAHYQHSQDFYDLCDEYGFVLWAEIPFISRFMRTEAARENTISQMTELVLQNYNHTSIMFWGISNEISMEGEEDEALLANLRELNDLCHKLDSTRLTTIANLSMVDMESSHNHITDVLSYNHYFGWYGGDVSQNGPWLDEFHQINPDRAIGLSEYGAEGNINLHSDKPENHDYTEEYQCLYHEGMLETFAARPYLWSTHVWNMFEFASDMRDEGGIKGRNNKGLVNYSRTIKKDSFYLYKAYWTSEPFVYICSRRYYYRPGKTTTVKVYATGVDSVKLYAGKKEIGTATGKHVFVFENVPLSMLGTTKIRAEGLIGEKPICSDEIELKRVSKPHAEYRLEGDTDAGNWFQDSYGNAQEVSVVEGYFSINDKLGDVMANQEGAALIQKLMDTVIDSMAGESSGGIKISKGMMKMLSSMTFESIGKMAGGRLPKGAMYELNKELNKIKK